MTPDSAALEASVEIAVPPEDVWPLVADVTRMGEWSPQCRRVILLGGGTLRVGRRFVGINRRRLVVWPTTSRIDRYDPGRAISWKTRELNDHTWVTRTFAPMVGGAENHDAELQAGMEQTLTRIKAAAERRR